MLVSAWSKGSPSDTGAGYGIKLREEDRDRYFDQAWEHVVVELGGQAIEVRTNKKSFWEGTCRELIHRGIGRWLLESGLAPWAKGKPPKLELKPLGEGRFHLHHIPEQVVAQTLRVLLARVAVGDQLWQLDYDTNLGKSLLSALEFYLPALLREQYSFWIEESLDGFCTAVARKTGDHSAAFVGLAQLISDQAWTPLQLELVLARDACAVERISCFLGERSSEGLVRMPYATTNSRRAAQRLRERSDDVDWAFVASFDNSA